LRQSLERLPAQLELQQLEPLTDVDEWQDVVEVARCVPMLRQFLLDQSLC
jgi:hypothetical protein